MIAGIPTKYHGIAFHSRLEARWAAFFDGLGWKWNYEPFDLPGWIPDFMLMDRMLVEVKPFSTTDEFRGEAAKIRAAMNDGNVDYEVLLLGIDPFQDCRMSDMESFGHIILSRHDELMELCGDDRTDIDDSVCCVRFGNKWDLTCIWGTWGSRLGTCDFCKWMQEDCDREDLRAHWANASNRSQWRTRV